MSNVDNKIYLYFIYNCKNEEYYKDGNRMFHGIFHGTPLINDAKAFGSKEIAANLIQEFLTNGYNGGLKEGDLEIIECEAKLNFVASIPR